MWALEMILQTPKHVKARLSLATRVTGVRRLSHDGEARGVAIYKVSMKYNTDVRIALLSGDTLDFTLPPEARRSDFWAGTWLVQMTNMRRSLPPRQAAVLIQNDDLVPPWTRLSEIPDTA